MGEDDKYHSLTDSQWRKLYQAQALMESIQKEVGKDYFTLEWSSINNIADLLKRTMEFKIKI
jgi:hypothetical protein